MENASAKHHEASRRGFRKIPDDEEPELALWIYADLFKSMEVQIYPSTPQKYRKPIGFVCALMEMYGFK